MSNIKYSAPVQRKPYCKVCHDAGKTESEYTNHFVRSISGPEGKIVCPTLLSQECRYCHVKGHTSKYCSQAKKDKEINHRFEKKTQPQEKSVPPKTPSNKFAALMDESSDSENETKLIKRKTQKTRDIVEEFPVLCGTTPKIKLPVTTSISYAAKTAMVALNQPVLKPVLVSPKCNMSNKPKPKPELFKTSWADDDAWGSSDSEGEE